MADAPPLPPGFTMDGPSPATAPADHPPLPPGFSVDGAAAPAPEAEDPHDPQNYIANTVGPAIGHAFAHPIDTITGIAHAIASDPLGAAEGILNPKRQLERLMVDKYQESKAAGNSHDDAVKDTLNAGLTFAAPAALPHVLGAAGSVIGKAIPATVEAAQTLGRGFMTGAKEAVKDAPIFKTPIGILGGIKGAVKEAGDTLASKAEFGPIAAGAQKALYPGETGALGRLPDDQAVLSEMTSSGDNPTKQWMAQKSATLNPGQGSAEDYAKLLAVDSEARNTARAFVPREAAAALKPDVDQLQQLFEQARSSRWNELQGQARAAFDPSSMPAVTEGLSNAIADAEQLKAISPSTKSLLDDVQGMIHEGRGIQSQGLTPGPLEGAEAGEQFNRLQQARQLVDSKIKWESGQGNKLDEQLLSGVRGTIDDALKTSPEKIEADSLWSRSMDLEKKFFGATEFGKGGDVAIDEGKIAKLLGDTDQAHRFREMMQHARAFTDDETLAPEFRAKMKETLKSFQDKIDIANQKRALSSFRYKPGPTSPAVQRTASVMGKNSLLQDAVNAPEGFLNAADEFSKFVQGKTGQTLEQLQGPAKEGAIRYWLWAKKNPGATAAQGEQAWAKFMGGKPTGGGGPAGTPPVPPGGSSGNNRAEAKTDGTLDMAKVQGTRFAPMLAQAAQQGPQAVAIQHYMLSQKDPEYQGLMNG